jgi:hypothetical protein
MTQAFDLALVAGMHGSVQRVRTNRFRQPVDLNVALTFDDLPFADTTDEGRTEAVKADRVIRRALVRH